MGKLRIHDWEQHQTFRKDRGTPPWIKVHRNLLTNTKWSYLSDEQKGQIISIWMIAADNNGHVEDDPRYLKKVCMLDSEPDIEKFIELQLLDRAGCHGDAIVTPQCQPDDAPEKRQRREETEYIPPLSPKLSTGVDKSVDNSQGVFKKRDSLPYDIWSLLNDKGEEQARSNCQGWDLMRLARIFNESVASGKIKRPKYPNKAFPAWCSNYTKGKRP